MTEKSDWDDVSHQEWSSFSVKFAAFAISEFQNNKTMKDRLRVHVSETESFGPEHPG